ncbi:MAG: hypothetical protein DLM52_13230 [Chthoniobacterales bacterium]|nr:MAG: hypothetical protein DLM52_13230 [Chthoniobacterales bacterium]
MSRSTFLLLMTLAPALIAHSEAMNEQSHFAESEGSKVHYTVYGNTDPTLVFVHGWACDETVWKAQAPELGREMRCITIDLPGHGQSDKPELPYTCIFTRARSVRCWVMPR